MPFDIRQLRFAIAAADHGSFYRAARALDVEQSTLSWAILKLERSIGMPIFERSRVTSAWKMGEILKGLAEFDG